VTWEEEKKDLWVNIGLALQELRAQEGLTQRQAAALASSTQARISDLELGRADMFVSTLEQWARVYGYHVEVHFVPIEEDPPSQENHVV